MNCEVFEIFGGYVKDAHLVAEVKNWEGEEQAVGEKGGAAV